MRDSKRMHVNIADRKILPGMDGFHAAQTFFQPFRQYTLQFREGRFGDVERRFPHAEHLREAVAVIRVFMGNQNSIEAIEGFLYGSKARQRFAFSEACVNKEAGAFGFEQREVARTSRDM